jgi:hypothetical protein
LKGTPRNTSAERWKAGRRHHRQHKTGTASDRVVGPGIDLTGVPGADDQAAGVRVPLDLLNHLGNLVHGAPIDSMPGPPLAAIDRPKLTFFVSPLIPDVHTMFLQVANIGFATQEPQKLIEDRFQVQLLAVEVLKSKHG